MVQQGITCTNSCPVEKNKKEQKKHKLVQIKTYKTSICKSHYSYLNNCEKSIISIECSNEVKLVKSVFDGKPFHTLITRFAKNKLRTDLLQPALYNL